MGRDLELEGLNFPSLWKSWIYDRFRELSILDKVWQKLSSSLFKRVPLGVLGGDSLIPNITTLNFLSVTICGDFGGINMPWDCVEKCLGGGGEGLVSLACSSEVPVASLTAWSGCASLVSSCASLVSNSVCLSWISLKNFKARVTLGYKKTWCWGRGHCWVNHKLQKIHQSNYDAPILHNTHKTNLTLFWNLFFYKRHTPHLICLFS